MTITLASMVHDVCIGEPKCCTIVLKVMSHYIIVFSVCGTLSMSLLLQQQALVVIFEDPLTTLGVPQTCYILGPNLYMHN